MKAHMIMTRITLCTLTVLLLMHSFSRAQLPSGTYFIRASSGNFVKTVRLVLVK